MRFGGGEGQGPSVCVGIEIASSQLAMDKGDILRTFMNDWESTTQKQRNAWACFCYFFFLVFYSRTPSDANLDIIIQSCAIFTMNNKLVSNWLILQKKKKKNRVEEVYGHLDLLLSIFQHVAIDSSSSVLAYKTPSTPVITFFSSNTPYNSQF